MQDRVKILEQEMQELEQRYQSVESESQDMRRTVERLGQEIQYLKSTVQDLGRAGHIDRLRVSNAEDKIGDIRQAVETLQYTAQQVQALINYFGFKPIARGVWFEYRYHVKKIYQMWEKYIIGYFFLIIIIMSPLTYVISQISEWSESKILYYYQVLIRYIIIGWGGALLAIPFVPPLLGLAKIKYQFLKTEVTNTEFLQSIINILKFFINSIVTFVIIYGFNSSLAKGAKALLIKFELFIPLRRGELSGLSAVSLFLIIGIPLIITPINILIKGYMQRVHRKWNFLTLSPRLLYIIAFLLQGSFITSYQIGMNISEIIHQEIAQEGQSLTLKSIIISLRFPFLFIAFILHCIRLIVSEFECDKAYMEKCQVLFNAPVTSPDDKIKQ